MGDWLDIVIGLEVHDWIQKNPIDFEAVAGDILMVLLIALGVCAVGIGATVVWEALKNRRNKE